MTNGYMEIGTSDSFLRWINVVMETVLPKLFVHSSM